jgi:hypothetical protein
MNREPLLVIQDHLTDSNLRRLARDIRDIQWGRISRSEALQALAGWKHHVCFDGPEGIHLEELRLWANQLPD